MKSVIDDIESLVAINRRIGLFVSGGLDSAVLAKLVLDTRDKLSSNNDIVFFTVPRTDDSYIHASRVVENLSAGSAIISVGNANLHHSKQVLSGVLEALSTDSVDILLLGDTKNPIDLPDGPVRIRSKNPKVFQPFFNRHKNEIISLAIDLGYTDLFKITHTCTESKNLRCSRCWQCKERAWGFSQVNYADPGTM